ncbi:Protein of unknown function [Pseudomonas sp. NFR09]|uniref:DUF1120 domain-containing protein n=1 Tax=Pseudomonas sp. NFR09 TaxID=1566249 RepID=UPI0008BA886B|nr:DUF1120 domain-containing protein [Pseudomonas sp. NFR09]SES77819.1 Protein of unknown function [Pseudomonas sp. NFR09]
MKAQYALLFTTLLMTTATPLLAASSTDLNVSGLITPSACTPSLSGGGVVDFGKISAADLYEHSAKALPPATLQLGVECEAATLYAFIGLDNRDGSSIGGPTSYGLGLINQTERVGAFDLGLNNATADGMQVATLASRDNGATWQQSSENALWTRDRLAGFGTEAAGTWAPIPIRALSSDLRIYAVIAATSTLTLTEEQPLDGSATLELRYL